MNEYQSPLTLRYASDEMKKIFSPHQKYKIWRRLWVALANAEKKLGLPITEDQIEELKAHIEDIDFEKVRFYEKETRHEVMAHILAYGDICPKAKGIIHLGATSAYVMDNGDLIQALEGLKLIKARLIILIEKLHHLAFKTADIPCLGFTHFQPAQPTTFGKRASLWLQDFIYDFKDLAHLMETFSFLGAKGAVGSQASFLILFEGDREKVVALDQLIAEEMGFHQLYLISSQTFTRKQDMRLLNVLASLAASVHKCATDLRLLSHLNEVEEPFKSMQVGSSAMPYKRNPIFLERACSLARYVMSLWNNPAYTASLQWLERSLDDSANRRLTIPEAFLTTDSIISLMATVIDKLEVFPKIIEKHLEKQLPLLGMEHILAAASLKGKERGKIHEKLRQHAFSSTKQQREEGEGDSLIERISQDKEIGLSKEELQAILNPQDLIGCSKQQVFEFLKLEVAPLLKKNLTLKTTLPNLEI